MSRQNPPASSDPGNKADTPTMAMGISFGVSVSSDMRVFRIPFGLKPQASSLKPQASIHKPQASSREPRAASLEPRAASRERSPEPPRPVVEDRVGHRHAEAAELLRAGHDRRALEQVQRDLDDRSLCGVGQERARAPTR